MFPIVIALAGFGLLAWINSQPKTPPGGSGSGWDTGLMRDWAQREGMKTTWVALGSVVLIAGVYWGSAILIGFGAAAIAVPFFAESIARVWDQALQDIGGATLQSIGSAVSTAAGKLVKRLGPAGSVARGLTGLVGKLKGGVGAVQSLVDRIRPSAPPQMRGVLRATSGALFAGAAVLSILVLVEGDTGEPAGLVTSGRDGAAASGGGVAQVDTAWLEAFARQWFTYDGLDSWLQRLQPYLAGRASEAIRECAERAMASPLVLRMGRTSIVEGPVVEVLGPAAQLEAHPAPEEFARLYGRPLAPGDVAVRLSAVVARELAGARAQLPGTEVITRPQKVSAVVWVMDGKVVPNVTECGRGVAFVG